MQKERSRHCILRKELGENMCFERDISMMLIYGD
jgi:hypothetical protein